MFKSIISRGWYPALITAIAVVSLIYELSINIMIPVLVVILCIGLIIAVINARKSQLELQSVRLSQLTSYFNRRFMGNSSLSVFAVIDNLFSVENPQVWEWARGCEMAHRVFDSWTEHFADRVETDLRNRRYTDFLHNHLNELWAINNHYYDFTEQFCEIADKFNVPKNVIEQYNRFVTEYNAFVENFRNTIMELKNIARTQIEAPSVKLARELPVQR
jgi:hypothetical protein